MAQRYLGHEMLVVGPAIRTGMPILIDNPREVGADRLVNAVAAYERCGNSSSSTSAPRSPRTWCRPRASTWGDHRPGRGDLVDALYERAKLPKVELAQPRR